MISMLTITPVMIMKHIYLMRFYSLLCVHVLLSNQFLCFLQPFTDDTFTFAEIMPTANSLLKFL
jgi:hypothetical protein